MVGHFDWINISICTSMWSYSVENSADFIPWFFELSKNSDISVQNFGYVPKNHWINSATQWIEFSSSLSEWLNLIHWIFNWIGPHVPNVKKSQKILWCCSNLFWHSHAHIWCCTEIYFVKSHLETSCWWNNGRKIIFCIPLDFLDIKDSRKTIKGQRRSWRPNQRPELEFCHFFKFFHPSGFIWS